MSSSRAKGLNIFFLSLSLENPALYEIMWKNILEPGRSQKTTWRMITCWVPQATSVNSEYVILKVFPLKQWLHDCASL